MSTAASKGDLESLHKLVAQSLTQRIELDMKDEIPTDAATLGAAIKFLKDNNVSADPADSDDLANLRDTLTKQREARRSKATNVIDLVKQDMQREA